MEKIFVLWVCLEMRDHEKLIFGGINQPQLRKSITKNIVWVYLEMENRTPRFIAIKQGGKK